VVKRAFDNDEQVTPTFIKDQVFAQYDDISVGGWPPPPLIYLFVVLLYHFRIKT